MPKGRTYARDRRGRFASTGGSDPNKKHGSGTGLTSAYRYLKPAGKIKSKNKSIKPEDLIGKRIRKKVR